MTPTSRSPEPTTAPAATPVSRRTFLQTGGSALVLGWFSLSGGARLLTAQEAEAAGVELNAFISIDAQGKVTLVTHRAEMGQGAYSVVPQILAEELEVDLDAVQVVVAPGDSARYGSQLTGGSSTVRGGMHRLLVIGATARDMLVRAAAARWGVSPDSCRAERGEVRHDASARRLGYGALVADAARLQPAANVALKDRRHYRLIGKPLPRLDIPAKVNGSARFGIDVRLPGMLYAVVERSPRFEGRVKRFDASRALAVPGVKHVLKVERDVFGHLREGVAVVATSTWAAIKGRRALEVEWDETGLAPVSSADLAAAMRQSLDGSGIHFRSKGDVPGAMAQNGATVVDATYETPYQAHACMEPINCTAHVTDDGCEVWGPIQGPDWIRGHLSQVLKLPMEKVRVNMTFLGGGFGRKAFTDYPHEAALLSRAVRAPVQVVWTREDDIGMGPFRPGMTYRCRGAVRDGRITAFDTLVAGQNMGTQAPSADKRSYNGSILEGLPEEYLDTIPHYRFADAPLEAPIPVMWWRSVYSSTNSFAFESFLDELAVAAKVDPIDFRRRHFSGDRLQRLADRLEAVSGWKSRGDVRGYGVSFTWCFDSYAAHVVKVSRAAAGGVAIDRVWTVLDCGLVVNPDVVRAQVEGSIVMALGAAVTHQMTFEGGRAVPRNFDRYPLPRMRDIPPIEVHLMESDAAPGGAGEPALPGFTPALTNAIHDLTGRRFRTLPLDLRTA